jgi:hypothetical protein
MTFSTIFRRKARGHHADDDGVVPREHQIHKQYLQQLAD